MTKSKEEKEQQAIAEQERQAIEAQNTQANAGIPPNATDSNVPQATAAEQHVQTIANVSTTQAQLDAQAQATTQQNIEGDAQAHKDNENMRLLKRLVGKASPIVEDVKEVESSTDAEGNPVEIPTFKKVTKGYTYYAVNGKPFEDWVAETFNGKITVDTENNKIIYNEQ